MRRAAILGCLSIIQTACFGWITFTDVTTDAGVDFLHVNGATGAHHFPETIGGGAVFFDYDRDGWLDLYLVNAGDFQGDGAPNALYRNNGDGTFTDATDAAGVGDTGYGAGAVAGDYDGDGWEDLYICNFARNTLYRNNGDGTFSDATDSAGVGEPRWGASAAFFDADNDVDLDLIVANYLVYSTVRDGCAPNGVSVYCGPENFDGTTETLYLNNGDGTFTDVSERAGIASVGRGLAVVCGDYDNDGDADIFVANDMSPNFLYRNQGDGTFEEVGFIVGFALGDDALMGNGMGVDLADINNDGWLDAFVTNFEDQTNTLYRNDGDGFLTDISYDAGIAIPSLSQLAWGCAIKDFDNDGFRDLFVVNGHIHDNLAQIGNDGSYPQPIQLFRNAGNGRFDDLSRQSGDAVTTPRVGRGAAFGDYDNDGDLDAAVNNLHGKATLLRNDGGSDNGWVRVELQPAHLAAGARVFVESEDGSRTWSEEIHTGGSYASHSDTRALIGIGETQRVRVWVMWRDRTVSTTVEADTRSTLRFQYPTQ
ncbi:MAG: CRTAC1 family protein [Candidatus Poribacteria bacterium]|nr:CRTAC1 family protein [Candidatus Poribacteria bacterium]